MKTGFIRACGFALMIAALGPVACVGALADDAAPVDMHVQTAPASIWDSETFDRQEFREEMEQIRRDHEDLVNERIALQAQCATATGSQAATCAEQKQSLQDRCAKLHERVHALHEKVAAARQERENHGQAFNDHPTDMMPGMAATSVALPATK